MGVAIKAMKSILKKGELCMSKKMCIALLFGTLIIVGSAHAAAWNNDGQGPNGKGQSWGQQLTPQQRKQAEQIFNENFASMNETRDALAQKRQQLNMELQSENPDSAKIESLSREIGELRGKMLAARVKVRSELASEGLPEDFYGPNPGMRKNDGRGPEVWHGGHHGKKHHRPRGYGEGCWGCPGWNYGPGMMR